MLKYLGAKNHHICHLLSNSLKYTHTHNKVNIANVNIWYILVKSI